MLHRKLDLFCQEQRPVWVFLKDQQRWIEQALVVEIEGDLVTLRYDDEDDDELHTWEESVRLDSIGAVSTRLSYFSRSAQAEDLETAEDCPESEQLRSQG
jgi:RNA-binding protein YlmH